MKMTVKMEVKVKVEMEVEVNRKLLFQLALLVFKFWMNYVYYF